MKVPILQSVYHTKPTAESRRLSWEADHANGIPGIGPQAYPVKQADQGDKTPLDPSRLRRCNYAIFRIEEGIMMLTLMSELAPLFRSLHHHIHPVTTTTYTTTFKMMG